ncbi:Wzz/FepE/Etk N-terminal domain-containing protein [Candidatus Latescibacterota bacterium]
MTEFNENDKTQSSEEEFESIDFSQWISFFWSNRSFFIKVEIVCLIIGVIIALILPQRFTAVATLLPAQSTSNSSRILSQLSNIVGDIPISGGESLVDLYPDIATSRGVLTGVLDAPYKNGTFEQALLKENNSDQIARESLIILLKRNIIKGAVNNRTKSVTISATTTSQELSASLANEVLNQMEIFFGHRIKSVATSQRLMIEDRLKDIADSLKIAEDNLLSFNEGNRSISGSPTLKITELRLAREVEINNTLYIELTRQHEVAKINELQYKPILNILEKAVPPLQRSAPARKKIVLIFLLCGFFASFSFIKLKEFIPKIIKNLES